MVEKVDLKEKGLGVSVGDEGRELTGVLCCPNRKETPDEINGLKQ